MKRLKWSAGTETKIDKGKQGRENLNKQIPEMDEGEDLKEV